MVWSMWDGYLEDRSAEPLLRWIEDNRLPMIKAHTSGHACVADLERFAAAVSPKRLVPIHSFSARRFAELFENVDLKEDGEWWTV